MRKDGSYGPQLNPKGQMSRSFLKKMDDKYQFQNNNYGDNFMGMGQTAERKGFRYADNMTQADQGAGKSKNALDRMMKRKK